MSNAGVAFLAGLLHGGLDQYKTSRKWNQEDELKQAFLDAVKDSDAGGQAAQPAPAQSGTPDRQAILREFGEGLAQPLQPRPQPNSASNVGNYGVETHIPAIPAVAEQVAQAAGQQAAPAPVQAVAAPVAQSTLTPSTLAPVSSMISRQEPQAIAGIAAARDAIAREDAGTPAPTVGEQITRSVASLGGAGGGVAGQGLDDLVKGADLRGRQEDAQTKKFALAAALKGDLHSALALTQEVRNRQYAREDLKYAVGVASDPTGEDAQKLVKLIGQASLPGTSIVTDPKTGIATVQLQQPDGSSHDIPLRGSALMRTAVAYRKAMRGDPSALADLAAVSKDYAAQAVAGWQFNQHLATTNNNAANIKSNIGYRDQRAGIQDRRYDQQERRLDAQERKADAKDAQEAELRAATAAYAANPDDPQAKQRFYEAGGRIGDAAHLTGGGGNQPMEVKLAEFFLKSGQAKDMKEAGQMAIQAKNKSPQQFLQDVYVRAVSANPGDKKAVQEAVDDAKAFLASQNPATDAPAGGAAGGGSAGPANKQFASIPAGAVAKLRSDPKLAEAFDQKYGQGMSALALGQ